MVKEKVIVIKSWKKYSECTRKILEAKKQYILKMTNKVEDNNTLPKKSLLDYHKSLTLQ